ncbi:MAG TPA: DUF952 domain-containing protein [Ferruginibacter sp.]|nr:DUF952 domain-containing protein [Ferruginibacter sp.]
MIYHVVARQNWEKAQQQGFYEADSLASEGFIHCSDAEQVAGVLERYYKDQTGLLLLHIEEDKLIPTLTYELAPSVNEEFPHIYGRLNLDAVIKVAEL